MPVSVKNIELNTVIYRDNSQPYSEIDGEVVMLNVKKEAYFALNKVGSKIWSEISEPCVISNLIDKIQQEYSVSVETCFKDIKPFIEELVKANIIKVK